MSRQSVVKRAIKLAGKSAVIVGLNNKEVISRGEKRLGPIISFAELVK